MSAVQQLIDWQKAFLGASAADAAEWVKTAVELMQEQQQEILTLRSQIKAAPVAVMDTRAALGLFAPTVEAFEGLYALQGHKVALIDLGVEK